MYLQKHFSGDAETAMDLMEQFPFATLISTDEKGTPFVNHIPILARTSPNGDLILEGHMARRNPQWHHFSHGSTALAVFHGPHTYITPKWYSSGRDVPTWNYAAVHAQGSVRLVDDFDGLIELLQRVTSKFESASPDPWSFELPSDLTAPHALTTAIVGFAIKVQTLEVKVKLSQNRPKEDRLGVIVGLAGRQDEMSQMVHQMMLQGEK
ncbi:MAG: FMN-binding negative transcriptional regulator [Bdellovibrionaceae bacterium]|nr:FMN-binding negative transcriptional regulator [Pseudobdellovibrionaceae bacterium]